MAVLVSFLVAVSLGLASSSGVTVGLHPELHPIHSLYHSQDWHGQYAYGFATPMITRNEVRNMDGTTVGGYSYMDSNGVLQTVKYKVDPVRGFEVAASNLPQDLPDVAEAKAKHLALFKTIQENHALGAVPKVTLPQPVEDLPEVVAARRSHMAAVEAAKAGIMPQPVPVQETPEVANARAAHLAFFEATRIRDESLHKTINFSPIPQGSSSVVALPSQSPDSERPESINYKPAADVSQYENLGIYSYGYTSPLSSKVETKTIDGVTRGGYSYIDANGILQTVKYISDDKNGFRVLSTNLLSNPIKVSSASQIKMEPQQNVLSSDKAGFIITADNSLQNDRDDALLYRQEIQY